LKCLLFLRSFDLRRDRRRDAVPHHVPAGTKTPRKLQPFRDGEVAPDSLSERAKLVNHYGWIPPIRPEPGAVLFN
jgi:hypothetical protein